MSTDKVIITIVAVDAVVLALIFSGIAWWVRRLVAGLDEAISQSGEAIVIESQRGLYLRKAGIASLKTEGAVALTDRRLVFRKPLGGDISLPLSEMEYVSRAPRYKGCWRRGRDFLVVEMKDGSEAAFMVKDPGLWIRQMLAWEDPA